MSAPLIIAMIDGFIAMIEKLAPMVQQLAQKGEVTVEQQTALMNRMADLDRLELFTGPEWRVDPDPPTEPPTP